MNAKIYRLFKWIQKGVPVIKVIPKIAQLEDGEKLRGRNIVVVGGSRGIGFHIARKCTETGAQVLISGRSESTLKEAAELIGCKYAVFDVIGSDGFRDFIDNAETALGGQVDSLVYNAALYLHEKSIMEVTEEGFEKQFSTNLKAPYFLSQEFIKYLERNKAEQGNILFITSEMGLYCNDVPYGLGKASLNSFVEGLSRRYVKNNIRVNAIAPGVMINDISGTNYDDIYRKHASGQRYILPEEIAEVAGFLLSNAANCIAGAVIPCNQGNHLRCDW